jgi:IS1 family transposase
MNRLPTEKRAQILKMLVEGSSMRLVARVADVSINTVVKLLIDAGAACTALHSDRVRGLRCRRVQCDEIWSFCYSKAKNVPTAKSAPAGAGDVWTWSSLCADSKLICNWMVGGRDSYVAMLLMDDLKSRLSHRVQFTTDGHRAYLEAVEDAFGDDIDYAMLIKLYGTAPEGPQTRYSPAECIGIRKNRITGDPDPAHVSTSYSEAMHRQLRMSLKRLARLSNGHSKKLENHCHALALYFVAYNWIKIHTTLRVTPAMAAGLTDRLMDWDDLVGHIDSYGASQKSNWYSAEAYVPLPPYSFADIGAHPQKGA